MKKALVLVALLAVLAAVAGSTSMAATAPVKGERTYHLAFKRVEGINGLTVGSGWLAVNGSLAEPWTIRLISGSTGRTVTTLRSDCAPEAVGGIWLARICRTQTPGIWSYDLYNIPRHRRVPFRPSPPLAIPGCAHDCVTVEGIGSDWIGVRGPCAGHCSASVKFQNLTTGRVRANPTNAHTRLDLDSPRLGEPVCRPLAVPIDDQPYENVFYPPRGSVTMDGKYGIEAGSDGVYLQRCGSRKRTFLTSTTTNGTCAAADCPPANDHSMIIWQDAPGRLGGIFLHGLRRFRINVPASIDPGLTRYTSVTPDPYTLAIAGDKLYLLVYDNATLWTARLPTAP